MTGSEYATLCTELNGGASIGETLLFQLLNMSKAIVEQRRPWVILRKTDSSLSATPATTWQTAISLAGITDFNRFYGDAPITLFDGMDRTHEYAQVSLNEHIRYRKVPNTFVHDEANNAIYLNGTPPFAGTLYIDYLRNSPDLAKSNDSTWVFPSWSHALLAFFAVAIHKGGVDYDDINARMAPENRAAAATIMTALETWDSDKQLAISQNKDYSRSSEDGWRDRAINFHA
jgi:hypothetical protein